MLREMSICVPFKNELLEFYRKDQNPSVMLANITACVCLCVRSTEVTSHQSPSPLCHTDMPKSASSSGTFITSDVDHLQRPRGERSLQIQTRTLYCFL
jgi:hypothetical protein